MVEKIKALWIKYEEIIAYLIVGGLTTVVSWAAKMKEAVTLMQDRSLRPKRRMPQKWKRSPCRM